MESQNFAEHTAFDPPLRRHFRLEAPVNRDGRTPFLECLHGARTVRGMGPQRARLAYALRADARPDRAR